MVARAGLGTGEERSASNETTKTLAQHSQYTVLSSKARYIWGRKVVL